MLYVNGDSFSYGVGISSDDEEIREKRFSKLLSNDIGLTEHNVAVPGSCNLRIARRSMIDLYTLKPKFAIITWSDPSRIEFTDYRSGRYRFDEDALQLRVSSLKFDHWMGEPAKEALEQYYANLSSPYSDVMHTLQHMLSVDIMCRHLNIPCLQLWFRDTCVSYWMDKTKECPRAAYQRSMEELITILKENKMNRIWNKEDTFESLSQHNFSKKDDHPNALGHELVYQWIKQTYFDK
jgi:hypothetical protein